MGNIKFDLDKCCGCNKEFDSITSKSLHHVFPLFLKPAFEVTIPLCKECHKKLNDAYVHVVKTKKGKETKLFTIFKNKYNELRDDFAKDHQRGKFGEGLWSNLVEYLEATQPKK